VSRGSDLKVAGTLSPDAALRKSSSTKRRFVASVAGVRTHWWWAALSDLSTLWP
jgi:hypothetical protein